MRKCAVCGREQLFPTEGRVVDGSWDKDARVPEQYQGCWVCCWNCYERLTKENKETKGGDV